MKRFGSENIRNNFLVRFENLNGDLEILRYEIENYYTPVQQYKYEELYFKYLDKDFKLIFNDIIKIKIDDIDTLIPNVKISILLEKINQNFVYIRKKLDDNAMIMQL
jgi:hypothetical protein